jgi:hypothetical protein
VRQPSKMRYSEAPSGLLAPCVDLEAFCSDISVRRRYLPTTSTVSDYKVTSDRFIVTCPFAARGNGHPEYFAPYDIFVAIRTFEYDGIPSRLLVNARTCKCGIVDAGVLRRNSRIASDTEFLSTRLFKALTACRTGEAREIIDSRVTDCESICIVVDMCQSSVSWDPSIFIRLISIGKDSGTPVRITIAPAGRWIIGHFSAFAQLVAWHKTRMLDIEWANHTMNHPLNTDMNGIMQFLCSQESDLTREVLALEILLLEQGVCPSLWFRFPGNKYTMALLSQLSQLSLIPLGITSWLERGDDIKVGSTVLIHANGNDEAGAKKLDNFLLEKARPLREGKMDICGTHRRLDIHNHTL